MGVWRCVCVYLYVFLCCGHWGRFCSLWGQSSTARSNVAGAVACASFPFRLLSLSLPCLYKGPVPSCLVNATSTTSFATCLGEGFQASAHASAIITDRGFLWLICSSSPFDALISPLFVASCSENFCVRQLVLETLQQSPAAACWNKLCFPIPRKPSPSRPAGTSPGCWDKPP